MTFGSLFAGIGGFDLGWHRCGMRCLWQVEINEHCRTVLSNHFPDVPKIKDVRDVMRSVKIVRPDWLCGGFPCQDLSVAGKRAGLDGARSGLWFEFKRIIGELLPSGVCIENVPGLLSSAGGRDFAVIISGLVEMGYGVAWRILDAQWFGVTQRRRRVFIVGCRGSQRRAGEILFESESLPWDSPPRREAGARVAANLTAGVAGSSGVNPPGRRREDDVNLVQADATHTHTLRAEGHDASEDGTGRGVQIIPIDMRQASRGELMTNNRREGSSGGAPGTGIGEPGDPCPTLADSHTPAICFSDQRGVRRLTPTECERLQGFPDGWTAGLSDSARYRCLGNAVAVPCATWIGRRILEAERSAK